MTQAVGKKTLHWLREEFQPEQFLPGIIAGVLIGITDVVFALSMGSLIFSGELAPYISYGIGIALVTSAVLMIGTSLISSVPGVISSSQDSPSVILAVIVAGLMTSLSATRVEDKLATVLIAITFTTLLTGIFFLVLGFFKLGGLVRFIPYPVVGGFLAGTGWLLLQGSFSVMTGIPLNFANIPALLQPTQLIVWIPGIFFSLTLFFGLRYIHHVLAMPGILVGAVALFYLALLATGTSIEEATRQGLLLGGVSGEITLQPLALKNLLATNWASILGQGSNIAIVLILSVISLLLNASGLELAIRHDIDLNRELRATGIANIFSGLLGGMVGYHALSFSSLSYRIGARGRLPGLVAGSICGLMLFSGSALIAYFPKPILGGLLLFLGMDFLFEWVIAGWSKLSHTDYAIVLLILIVIGATNFLVGVGVGLVAAIILFVLNYSQINVIYHSLSGGEIRSNVERCAYHQRVLADLGQRVHIFELQGFIFFGTANALLEQVRARIADAEKTRVRYIILDFRRVNGLDSSAVLSFVKGRQLVESQEITLVLTHISENIKHQFELGGLFENEKWIRIFPDLDHGLEWCEEQLLEIEQVTTLHTPITLTAQLADSGFEKNNTKRLMSYLERVNFKEGDTLIHQGDEADRLYFIEMGAVSIYLELGDQQRVRLQTLGLGTAIGEPGLYLGTKSNTSVIADMPVTAYRLTRTALSEMKQKEPELAATFHEFAARLLSERLTATTRTLEALLK